MNNVWDKVKLLTHDHGFVVSGKIPHFDVPPSVILWGDRTFAYFDTGQGIHTYLEAFAVYLVRTD